MKTMDYMDLQMFAETNLNTTLSATTGNDLSAEMKTYYDMTLLDNASPKLVHEQFGQKRPIPKGKGKTIEFRKFSPLPEATTPITEGVTPIGNKLDVTDITATVDQYGDYVVLSDVLELTAVDPIIVEATKLIGNQAGTTLDTIVRNKMVAGTNVTYCPKFVSGKETAVTSRADLDTTAKLTVDVVKQVVAKLQAMDVPDIDGDYVAIIHPYAAYDLMSDKAWEDAHKYARPENIYTGEIGKIAGVRFVKTSKAKIFSGSGCPAGLGVFCTLFLGANAYGVTDIDGGGLQTIVKQKGSGGTSDPLNQRSSVGWKAMKTAKILVESNMVRVESCSERYSASAKAN